MDLLNAGNSEIVDFRLPSSVVPERYDLRLQPDLQALKFEGRETVSVSVRQATREVVLNAIDLEIHSASAERDGSKLEAKVELKPDRERARLRFDRELAAGPWLINLSFAGTLNDKLHGFYRSVYQDSSGKSHTIAATQFEATDARRAFPCWDEPALKARFKVALVVDQALTAISNSGVEREQALGNGKKVVEFRETIPMSTYLVAFIVGEFEATAPVDARVPLRVVHVPGKQGLTGWAREVGKFALEFFADYYGLEYPGDKLDLIAIPDFASGAMENLGAITFRETALLVDEKSAARSELERVADVVCHEIAHMWFGDLVTMEWWNGIWLNEAFATFMEMLAVDALRPRWRRWETFATSRAAAMAIDGLVSTRPIEYTVRSPEEARAMFDVLTYEKGASVLRMLEQYLGAEVFRKGIALYLRKHRYANAETGDLWDALEESSGAPVRELMDSWIFQPGFPLLEVATAAECRALKLKQRRFFYLRPPETAQQLWQIPVIMRIAGQDAARSEKMLLGQADQTIDLSEPLDWVLANEEGRGFYRVGYSAELRGRLVCNLGRLTATERFGLISDAWAATVAGVSPLAEFLGMAKLFENENDLSVWRALLGPFNYLDLIVEEDEREALAAFLRRLARPALDRLGWTPGRDEDELTRQLRGVLFGACGALGDDSEVQRQAEQLFGRYREDPAAIDRDVAPALVAVLAHSGDPRRFEEFKQNYKSAPTPQLEQRYLFALAAFRRPELLRRTMEMTLNGEVRTQNAPYLLHSVLLNPAIRYEAWDFIKRNWETICQRFPDSALPRMCDGVVALLEREQEVESFFAAHRVRIGGKLIDQHLERLKIAVAFKHREGPTLRAALER